MDEAARLKETWRGVLARIGAEGRQWRKLAVLAERHAEPLCDVCTAALKQEIKFLRRARAEGHWSFRPERLRRLLARYLDARKARTSSR